MTSFENIARYAPLVVALVGLTTFAGLWAMGSLLLHFIQLRLVSPWSSVTATLLGIQTISLAVQITGMPGKASLLVLKAIWIFLAASGVTGFFVCFRPKCCAPAVPLCSTAIFPLAIIAVALLTNLLVSLAPSTKIDELYYHMLVPSRIVMDGALEFYRMPWEAAVWPQMTYQISATPLHALGYPDAANVVSWGLSVMLIWFAWRVISINSISVGWTAFWVASLCIGIYPVVWHTTAGANAMGDLAMAAAIVAFAERNRLLTAITPPAYAMMLSLLLIAAATSKVTLLPACTLLLCLSAWRALRSPSTSAVWHVVVLAFLLPWFIFYLPLLIWTWVHSGSPFGSLLTNVFGPSIYPHSWVTDTLHTRWANQTSISMAAYSTALNYPPLIWFAVLGAICLTNLTRGTRAALGTLFGLQVVLIYFLLPYESRFLGGIQYGLVIVFASNASSNLQHILNSPRSIIVACAIFLVPWLGIQIYYARQFFPVSLGLERDAFFRRYIAFYDDYAQLDRILPEDAVLLTQDFRLSAVYAPRPIFFDAFDIPSGKQVYLLSRQFEFQRGKSTSGGFTLGHVIYKNSQAIVATFRTLGRTPLTSPIQVTHLHRK